MIKFRPRHTLKRLRAERGDSLRKVAHGVRMSYTMIHYYETGQAVITAEAALRLARYFGVDFAEFYKQSRRPRRRTRRARQDSRSRHE